MTKKLIIHLAIMLLAISGLDFFVQYELNRQHENDQRLDVTSELSTLRALLEKEITSNLLLVQGTANFISVTPNLNKRIFNNFANRALEGTDLLKNIGAAPDFVMKFVYPEEGNQGIIGLNYKELPNQWEQVQKVALTGRMVVAGPIKLIQGGVGLIGRAPVYVYEADNKHFWGIVSSVIDVERLYDKVGIDSLDIEVALRGVDGRGENGAVFKGRPELFEAGEKAVMLPVHLPTGEWVMAGKPKSGWGGSTPMALWVHLFFAVTAIAASVFLYRADRHNAQINLVRKNLNVSQSIAHLGSWELHHQTGHLWWSDETYRIFGLAPEEVTPSVDYFMSIVHPDDKEKVEEELNKSMTGCGGYAVDHRIVRRDGGVRHVQERGSIRCDSKGNPVLSRGTVLDITERALAEEASRANAEQMRAMSEASHDALIMIDSDDRILFWSRAAERMFGWDRSEAMGQKMHLLIAPEKEREEAWQGLKHFSYSGQGPVIGSVSEFMALKRDGSLFPVERSVSAFALGNRHYAVGTIRDITERKKAEQELHAYSERLKLASKAGQIGVWEWDVRDNDLVWDAQMLKLYAVDEEDFSGLYEAWTTRLHPDDLNEARQSLEIAAKSEGMWEDEFRIVWPNGEVRHIKAAALLERDEKGDPLHMIGVNWDVTESRRTQEQLSLLATTDSMTGLFNRRYFMELSQREIERSRRYKTPFSLIMFDADRFKSVNDTYGHDVGDLVLKAIAETVKGSIRDVDVLGRIGGEEFAVGLPEAGVDVGKQVAEKIRNAVESTSVELPDGRTLGFTVSLGVAEYADASGSLEDLIKMADNALYQAKRNGRNRVECAGGDTGQEA